MQPSSFPPNATILPVARAVNRLAITALALADFCVSFEPEGVKLSIDPAGQLPAALSDTNLMLPGLYVPSMPRG
jgi:hypothetical protein